MHFPHDSSNASPHTGTLLQRGGIISLTVLVFVGGTIFAVVAGPPRLPLERLPQATDVLGMLSRSSLPIEPLVVALVDLVWLLWIWIVASLVIEVLVIAAEFVAHGAAWAASLRRLANRISMPLVRQAVAAAFTFQVISRGVPIASAQTLPPPETPLALEAAQHPDVRSSADSDSGSTTPIYVVRQDDTLWSISERAYGSGTQYRRIVDANLGQRMSDGQVFSALGVIRPGWQLRLPGATWNIDEVDGERWYTVAPGDSLSSIAGSLLGDRTRWQDLFELNAGDATADGTHTLNDPDLIWPGLRLRLPRPPDSPPASESFDARSDPDPTATDLVAASATAATPNDTTSQTREAAAADLPPLLRTAHVWDPVALESVDTLSAEAPASESLPSAGDADVSVPPTPARPDIPIMPLALGGLGLAAVAGFAFGAHRMRRLRPLPRVPENDVVVSEGFADAQLAHDLTRGAHGIGFDPVAALVGQLQRFLGEYNLADAQVVAARHGHSSTTLTLHCTLAEQPLLLDLAPVFAGQLGAEAEAAVSIDQDVQLKLLHLRKTRLLPTAESVSNSPCLVPLGVLYDKQIFFATWDALGHVLVVSTPNHGADTILTSLVATITARRPPEQLRVWMIASRRALPAPLFDIPHLTRVIDPASEPDLEQMADDLRAELDWRARHRGAEESPNLLIVISELTALGAHAEHFGLLAAQAADLGVRIFAASSVPEDVVSSPMTPLFETRMVLRMEADEISVALLGVADAAFLSGGGRLYLRIDGRQPVELYGFQVSSEHLERLVRMMGGVYRSLPEGAARHLPEEPPAPESTTSGTSSSNSPPTDQPLSSAQDPSDPSDQSDSDWTTSTSGPPEAQADSPKASTASLILTDENSPPATATVDRPRAWVHRQPIQVICFGGPRVHCAGQLVWPSPVIGDAKPWEFLLYLACQPPEGVARDRAFDALWPEDVAPESAPHRFRQLRYRLRQILGAVPGGPRADGVSFERGVLRLDPGIVYSDAQEFLNVVQRARTNPPPAPDLIVELERARELFTGDLLEGPDAHRYAWVDERDGNGITLREHFRRHFQHASTRLAELYAAAGELDASIDLYRELAEIEPGDERLWLALFRLHAKRGDGLALVREEHHMREALHQLASEIGSSELGQISGPSPDTVREFQRLLASTRNRERAPLTA